MNTRSTKSKGCVHGGNGVHGEEKTAKESASGREHGGPGGVNTDKRVNTVNTDPEHGGSGVHDDLDGRRLTVDEAAKAQRFISQGMAPAVARREVLGAGDAR